jgi:MerR family transcriptional regulator, redox-sensitive transcriptional activator SoxR
VAKLSVGEIARQSGCRPSKIRYYEEIGLLEPAERINGRRCYKPEIVERLAQIRIAQEVGFSLSEIRQLSQSFPADLSVEAHWRTMLRQKVQSLAAAMQVLERNKALLEKKLNYFPSDNQ